MKTISVSILVLLFGSLQISAQQTPALFPEINDWTKSEPAVYGPHNLYEPIDGAADMFLAYHFEEMQAVNYEKGENYIRVEIYRHGTPIDAFGAYSQEKPDRDIYLNIGVEGYKDADYFNFVTGQHYIKMRTWQVNDTSMEAMDDIAYNLAKTLNNGAVYPKIFNFFPQENRVPHSEKYINEFILGYSFLHSSYEVNYKTDDKRYVLFILEGKDMADGGVMLTKYLEKQNQPADQVNDQFYTIDDRYNGTIYLLKSGKYLICSRGNISEEDSKDLLQRILEKLNTAD